MRPSQHGKKPRGRGRKQHNPLGRVYDSNGPDVKIRGTASHIADKYLNLARDAHSAGDRIAAESYFQHAEHYLRIIASAQSQMSAIAQQAGEQPPVDDAADQAMGGDNGQGGMRDDFGRDLQPHFEGRSRRGRRRNGMRPGDGVDEVAGAPGDGPTPAVSSEAEAASNAANGGGDDHRSEEPEERISGAAHDESGGADRSEPDPGTISA